MFKENKYKKWYYQIVNSRQLNPVDKHQYSEKHHIIPKSLGGTNNNDNLVELTAREHYICHILLIRMTTGQHRHKMLHAAIRLINSKDKGFIKSSRLYESLKAQLSAEMKINNPCFDQEVKEKLSKINKENPSQGMLGKTHSDESKKKMSLAAKGRVPWNKGTKGICKGNPGLKHTDDAKRKISSAATKNNIGRKHSEETKKKMAEARRRYWVKKRAPNYVPRD